MVSTTTFALQFSRLLEKSAESRPSLVEERSTCVQHDKNISIQTEIIAKWNGGLSRILRNIVTPMKRYCTRAWNRCSIRRMNETARVYARVYARGRYATVFLNRERWFRWMDAPLKAIFVSKHRTRRCTCRVLYTYILSNDTTNDEKLIQTTRHSDLGS